MPRKRERRRHYRVDVGLPIKIVYSKKKILSKTKNISVLGTYIETNKKIPIGSALDISLRLPKTGSAKTGKTRQISCAGVTFRCQPTDLPESKGGYGIGIFFRSFLKGGEKALSKYIDYILLREKKIGKIFMRKRKLKLLKQKGG